jgi:hypothetical protein
MAIASAHEVETQSGVKADWDTFLEQINEVAA